MGALVIDKKSSKSGKQVLPSGIVRYVWGTCLLLVVLEADPVLSLAWSPLSVASLLLLSPACLLSAVLTSTAGLESRHPVDESGIGIAAQKYMSVKDYNFWSI